MVSPQSCLAYLARHHGAHNVLLARSSTLLTLLRDSCLALSGNLRCHWKEEQPDSPVNY